MNPSPGFDREVPAELLDDMAPAELRRFAHEVADWIADFRAGIETHPVLTRAEPGDVSRRLPEQVPLEGEPMDAILRDFREIIVPATTHWNHPGFCAYFANSGSGPGVLGEALTAALNVNAMLWRTGPAATELETRVCDWLRDMLGLPSIFEGHIEDTASTSTLIALVAARHRATGGAARAKGLSGSPPLRVYCSEETHSSIEKAAIVLGLGQEGCRKIGVDAEFRLRPDELAQAIASDRAQGVLPLAVVATTGTTSTTSVDPVPAIASICREQDVWLHVDAAYGGAMAIVPEHRWVLEGVEEADSVVVNPHKWLFVPMDCSVLWMRDSSVVQEALSLVPPYLMTPEDEIARNLMNHGVAMGRRFRALKLWFVMRWFGWRRMAAIVRTHVELAAEFAAWVDETPGWERLAPSPMSVVLFRHHPEGVDEAEAVQRHNEALMQAVNREGRFFLSHTVVGRGERGTHALRVAIGNVGTKRRHLEALWEELRRAAAQLA